MLPDEDYMGNVGWYAAAGLDLSGYAYFSYKGEVCLPDCIDLLVNGNPARTCAIEAAARGDVQPLVVQNRAIS